MAILLGSTPQAREILDRFEWWKKGIIYQIYPMSFQDTSGNGVGDLPGILERLDYVERLGVDAVWLSPIYPSPMHDNGYDVSDYCDIHPMFGTLDDFDRLVEELHSRDMKLIVDLVPNHTSDEHPWFVQSRSSRDNPKRDWYIWADPKPDGSEPNNWLSFFGGPAWTLDEKTGQYYLHQFAPRQPELNYRHPEVLPAMLDVMRFWLERGVDGFRADVIWVLAKDPYLRDEPPNPDWREGDRPHDKLIHSRTQGLEETIDIIKEFRRVVDEYDDRFLVGEIYQPLDELVRYYGDELDACHQPFNFHLLEIPWKAERVRRMVDNYQALLPPGAWPNYVMSNHDRRRAASRVGPGQSRAALMLLLTLRGTPTVYYGEELGMRDVDIPREKWRDPIASQQPEQAEALARDRARTPMPWDPSPHGGFTNSRDGPWLPLGPDYPEHCVQSQEGDPQSHLALFRRLTLVRRREPSLSVGEQRTIAVRTPGVFCFRRFSEGFDSFLVCLNFEDEPKTLDLSRLGRKAEIEISTRLDRFGRVKLKDLELEANEGLLMRLD